MEDLLQALVLPEPEARQAWERWRQGIDVDLLPYQAQQFLPILNASLPRWLANDRAAGIFQGIVRMVWTQNQLRFRKAVEVAALLERTGVQPVLAGPLAWALQASTGAIRPVPGLTFLVKRGDLGKAADTLIRAGWRPYAELPSPESLDWSDLVSFENENLQLYLRWRLIPTAPEDALECERAFQARLSVVEWNRHQLLTTSPETTLLHILCGRREADVTPWQADIALTGLGRVDWKRFRAMALRFAPLALDQLQQLRQYRSLAIPELPVDNPAPLRRRYQFFRTEYRTWSYQRKRSPNWPGFLQYLAERWHVRSVWRLPFVAARIAVQYRRSLPR